MSMRDYSVYDFGYVFTAEMIDQLIDKLRPDNIKPGDTYEMAEYMGLEYIGEFTGDAFHLDAQGDDVYSNDTLTYSDETIYYFPIGTYSSLFQAAYQSSEELARSMKYSYEKWLPDDFDEIYKGVRHIVGTYYG